MPYSNPESNLACRQSYRRRLRERNRARLDALKAVPCGDCKGTFPPECMDFDHVRGEKLFGIAVNMNISWERLEAEIAKCEIVCANCHRIRTKKGALRG